MSIEMVLEFIDRAFPILCEKESILGRLIAWCLNIFCACPCVLDEYTGVNRDSTLIFTNPLTILKT